MRVHFNPNPCDSEPCVAISTLTLVTVSHVWPFQPLPLWQWAMCGHFNLNPNLCDSEPCLCCELSGDFETNASYYEPHELLYTLRAFGHLNYVPPNSSSFFDTIETVLMSKFSEFDPTSILELLVSFVYIGRFPVNFLGHIFSPHFLMQIKGWYSLAFVLFNY